MSTTWATARRELWLFALLAGAPAFAIAAVFHVHPWATPIKAQADNFQWALTGAYVAAGALGVLCLPWTKAAHTPPVSDGRGWMRMGAWSLGLGLLYGAMDMAISRLTPWGAHLAAVDRRNGFSTTFVNVHPPWSVLHYFHASIISESAFRLGPILILTWLVTRPTRGRFEAVAFWTFALLSAFIEPIEKAIMVRKWGLFGETPMEHLLTVESVAWQFVFAVLLRRFGWAAPILARFGYYLVVRCFHQ